MSWLVLAVTPVTKKSAFFVSIPKKAIPAATRRNRVKRLLREAIRLKFSGAFQEDKTYHFRVRRFPAPDTLKFVEESVGELLEEVGR